MPPRIRPRGGQSGHDLHGHLYSFQGGTADGAAPSGSLILGSDGNLYGMSNQGGASGAGTLFVLTLH